MIDTQIIVGVSLPRSGHQFLADLMLTTFEGDLAYVGRPTGLEVPGPGSLLYLKNHDDDGALLRDEERFYLIQHREPRGRLLSEAQRQFKNSGVATEDRDIWRAWLAKHAARSVHFYDKWVRCPPAQSMTIDYSRLCADPLGVLVELLALLGEMGRAEMAQKTCDAISAYLPTLRGDLAEGRKRFQPRDLSQSPLIPSDMLEACVDGILARCPLWRTDAATAA